MYLCCDRNNRVIGKVKTEKEAQEMCSTLGSSYMKIIPLLFWLMKDHNHFYTYNTLKGFLKHSEIMKRIKRKLKEKYNIRIGSYDSFESVEKVIAVIEEFLGDCSDMIAKRMQDPI